MDMSRVKNEPQLLTDVIARLRDIVASTVPEDVAERKSMLVYMGQNCKNIHTFYVLSQLETADLIEVCRRREISWSGASNQAEYTWQAALNAKALCGTADDIAKIRDAAREQGYSTGPTAALTYASRKYAITPEITVGINLETTEALLRSGADVGHDEGGSYVTAVTHGGVAMGRIFARNGLSKTYMAQKMRNAAGKGDLYDALREIYWEYARYSVPDAQTLVETKQLDDGGTSMLRVVFNFASGRVSEVMEWLGNKAAYVPVVRDFSFDDYGSAAIEQAREKLIELGGHPADNPRTLNKQRKPLTPKD